MVHLISTIIYLFYYLISPKYHLFEGINGKRPTGRPRNSSIRQLKENARVVKYEDLNEMAND